MARIVSLATANPRHHVDNAQAARVMSRYAERLGLKAETFLRILKNTQIESRYSVLGPDEVDAPLPLGRRNGLYAEQCLELGERVARRAIADAGLTPVQI